MLSCLVFLAVVMRLGGGLSYIRSVITGRSTPNVVTWFFWALAPAIILMALIDEGAGRSVIWITVALGVTPLVVFILVLAKGLWRGSFSASTVACTVLALIGVALWQATDNPRHAIVFSILVDLSASAPTLLKAYRRPWSEYPLPYLVSASSMVIALSAIEAESYADYMFPAYMLTINIVLFSVPYVRQRTLVPPLPVILPPAPSFGPEPPIEPKTPQAAGNGRRPRTSSYRRLTCRLGSELQIGIRGRVGESGTNRGGSEVKILDEPICVYSASSLVAYEPGLVATHGRTLGKQAMKLAVRNGTNGSLPGWGPSGARR